MPAYSYQERFVPMVLDGSKPHTIRARRKNPVKAGDTLYHYFGMRTKYCKKLAEDKCREVKTIFISQVGLVALITPWMPPVYDHEILTRGLAAVVSKLKQDGFTLEILSGLQNDTLAWNDGFRPSHTSKDFHIGSFELMLRWWKKTHALPFIGDIIYRDIRDG